MNLTIAIVFGVVLMPLTALGQIKLTASPDPPLAGKPVVLRVNAKPGPNTSIFWKRESGEGRFQGETKERYQVVFLPSAPGDVVSIVCEIKTSDGELKQYRLTLNVAGKASAPAPPAQSGSGAPSVRAPAQLTARPAQQAPAPAANPPNANQPGLPAGALAVDHIESVISAGFMGDAMVENGQTASLSGGTECHWTSGCYRLDFSSGKLGWAAFGWQKVPEGASANWGEYPGEDLSRGGYRSLRVWAKGEPVGGTFPRVQFKSGGNVAPEFSAKNRASYAVSGPFVQLTGAYTEYCLPLTGKDLSNIVSPFTIAVSKTTNPKDQPVVILFDDVHFSREACR